MNIPGKMQAIQQDEPNGRLTLREIPVPQLHAGQVLIRMAAAPINPSDVGSLTGMTYAGQRSYPFTPGLEGSGVVVAAGAGVTPRLMMGRRVACAVTQGGTWAEYLITSASACVPLNRNVSLEQGAMLLVNPMTALAMFEIAKRGGHRALVNTAAASALGGMIVRLGKRYSIPVINVVRRTTQVEMMRKLSADCVLNSTDADFAQQLRAAVENYHATLLLDAVTGSMTQQLADAALYGSTILIYSQMSEEPCVIDPRTAFVKHLRFEGWFLGNWIREKSLLQLLQLSQRVQSLLTTDLYSPVQQRLPLKAAQEALEAYVRQMSAGKVLLVMDGDRATGESRSDDLAALPN